jgi:hypothetical protein
VSFFGSGEREKYLNGWVQQEEICIGGGAVVVDVEDCGRAIK